MPHFVTWGAACYLSNWLQQKGANDYLNQDANSEYKLTALGYGEPAFAAYYPNCYSVFGFCDVDPDLASMGNARNSAEFGFTMIEAQRRYALSSREGQAPYTGSVTDSSHLQKQKSFFRHSY
jgi:hypothetical protein